MQTLERFPDYIDTYKIETSEAYREEIRRTKKERMVDELQIFHKTKIAANVRETGIAVLAYLSGTSNKHFYTQNGGIDSNRISAKFLVFFQIFNPF